jgi:hypothetical protein
MNYHTNTHRPIPAEACTELQQDLEPAVDVVLSITVVVLSLTAIGAALWVAHVLFGAWGGCT